MVTERWPAFLQGAWIDVWVTVVGFVLACVLGLVMAIARLTGHRVAAIPAFLYIQVTRGVPLYVMLVWVYFGIATVLGIDFSPFQAIIISLALTGSGYTAEIFRSGIEAVDKGHVEAAHSLGLGRAQTYRDVILPQALRIVIPPLGNTFVGLLKGATIMSVIAVPDMVFLAMNLNVTYFTPFEPFTAVGVILIGLVAIFSLLVYGVELAVRLP